MLSFEDKILIENVWKCKRFFAKRLLNEFPNNAGILNTSYKALLTCLAHRLILSLLLSNETYTPFTRWSWLDELAIRALVERSSCARRALDECTTSARRAGLTSWLSGHLNGVIWQTFTKLLVERSSSERSSSQLHRVNGVMATDFKMPCSLVVCRLSPARCDVVARCVLFTAVNVCVVIKARW